MSSMLPNPMDFSIPFLNFQHCLTQINCSLLLERHTSFSWLLCYPIPGLLSTSLAFIYLFFFHFPLMAHPSIPKIKMLESLKILMLALLVHYSNHSLDRNTLPLVSTLTYMPVTLNNSTSPAKPSQVLCC